MIQQITALIRTHSGREELFKQATRSCLEQGVGYLHIVDEQAPRPDFSYNLLCNDLKAKVTDGYFFFLDSDDFLIPGAAAILRRHLDPNVAVICQFLRNGRPKPDNRLMRKRQIVRGKIGMPCIILHASQKDIAQFGSTEDADYLFIKEVASKMPVKFIAQPLVCSPKRNRGQ